MPNPDRIERTIELNHRPEVVWRALTTAEGLETWFGREPTATGTRLTVAETGFAQAPEAAYRSNLAGWQQELAELVEYLDAAA